MGLADKITSKLSGEKNTSEAEHAAGKYKESASEEASNQAKKSGLKENAAEYADKYDKKAGQALGKDNLSGTTSGAGSEYLGGNQSSSGSGSGSAAQGSHGSHGSHGSSSYGTSGPSGISSTTGQNTYKDTYGHPSATGHNSGAYGAAAAGTAGSSGVAAGTAFEKKHGEGQYGSSTTESYGSSSSNTHSGSHANSLGSFTTGDSSLDQKIAKLDAAGQKKAKDAFERGYKDAYNGYSK